MSNPDVRLERQSFSDEQWLDVPVMIMNSGSTLSAVIQHTERISVTKAELRQVLSVLKLIACFCLALMVLKHNHVFYVAFEIRFTPLPATRHEDVIFYHLGQLSAKLPRRAQCVATCAQQ